MRPERLIALLSLAALLGLDSVRENHDENLARRELAVLRNERRWLSNRITLEETRFQQDSTPAALLEKIHRNSPDLKPVADPPGTWPLYEYFFLQAEDGTAVRCSLIPPDNESPAGEPGTGSDKEARREARGVENTASNAAGRLRR